MAADNIIRVGQSFRANRQRIGHVTRRSAENIPSVEILRDTLNHTFAFRMEFFNYRNPNNTASMDLYFFPPFTGDGIADRSEMPLTITQTGFSVGLDGAVGAENIWYPLVLLGDLNFAAAPSYQVTFQISTYGTGTYQHKIVFDGGAVDLTNVSSVGGSQIVVPVDQNNVISPPETIIKNAYIYGRVSNFSIAGWLHYASATITDSLGVYVPRVIGV